MKTFFDTSVLVPIFIEDHEHHERSLARFVESDVANGCCAAHSLAEIYATVTRLPGRQRLSADQALMFLDSVEERLEIIALGSREYRNALNEAANAGAVGGTIYDALLAKCALKAQATRILTWNVRHFQMLGKEIAQRVQTP